MPSPSLMIMLSLSVKRMYELLKLGTIWKNQYKWNHGKNEVRQRQGKILIKLWRRRKRMSSLKKIPLEMWQTMSMMLIWKNGNKISNNFPMVRMQWFFWFWMNKNTHCIKVSFKIDVFIYYFWSWRFLIINLLQLNFYFHFSS